MKTTIVILGICWIAFPQFGYAACGQPQPRLVCAEYSDSKTVIEATLLNVDNVLYESDPKSVLGRYYTLKIDRVYRGTPGTTIRVYEENDSGRASFSWKVGERYLLFLFASIEKLNEAVLELDGCGNSGPVARAKTALRQIDRLGDQKGSALIAGRVSDQYLDAPLQGIEVVARSGGKTYRASTDRKGDFRIPVPAGDYILVPEDPQISFRTYEMSYGDPENLRMQPGACAQVQFLGNVRR